MFEISEDINGTTLQTRNTDMGSDMTWYRTSYRKNWISYRYPYRIATLPSVSYRKCVRLLNYCVQFLYEKQNVSSSIGFILEVCPNVDPLCPIFQRKIRSVQFNRSDIGKEGLCDNNQEKIIIFQRDLA
jgi:hypothetical protein